MSRTQQDQVIDDDELETCPLCIEEFDLSDRNFKPCPCGYQICQFCYNNIKTTMNGLCPACRRQYDEKDIQWKVISPEELASHKENVAQQAKKKAAARKNEAARREADSLSRKHLAGIRVRQKNLVYVTGMQPTGSADTLSELLRRDEYFGQYGKIIKVVVSKAKDTTNPNAPIGVYVTFQFRDDAAKCIQAVDGAQNYDTRLRAQYGTTKYCSAYLRGETCANRSCMFLHEPGEESESFSRQDLSSMNVISTQSPDQANTPSTTQHPLQPQPPPQQAPQSIAAASQPTDRPQSRDDSNLSQADSTDSSHLPSNVSWANRHAPSRQSSLGPGMDSPAVPEAHIISRPHENQSRAAEETIQSRQYISKPVKKSFLLDILKSDSEQFQFVFDETSVTKHDSDLIRLYPSLFDPNGGARRRLAVKEEVERHIRENDTHVATQALSGMDLEDHAASGSLQLGGEPEGHPDLGINQSRVPNAIQPPTYEGESLLPSHAMSPAPSSTNAGRNAMAQPQQQFLLQQLQSASPAPSQNNGQQNQSALGGPSHGRQASRFSFANDTSASTNVKPSANPKYLSQQNSMMPQSLANQYSHSSQPHTSNNQYFSSGVQGPPPGLKATGTPPVSGGGMFGQGHGFATAGLGYGANNNNNRNANEEMMRELLRNRGGSAGSGQASDAGRRGVVDLADPSILQARMHQQTQNPYGSQGQNQGVPKGVLPDYLEDFRDGIARATQSSRSSQRSQESRLSTPIIPPGLSIPSSKLPKNSASTEQNVPLMAELGQMPNGSNVQHVPAAKMPVAELESREESERNLEIQQKQTNTENHRPTSRMDEASFPSLPKSVKQAIPIPTKKQQPKLLLGNSSVKLHATEQPKLPITAQAVELTDEKPKVERQHPGKLDISAATEAVAGNGQLPDVEQSATSKASSPLPSSVESHPDVSGLSSDQTLKRSTQPRTLRLVATPKTETPPAISGISTPVSQTALSKPTTPSGSLRIRNMSIASTQVHDENASDVASITTTSFSRANSPPPGLADPTRTMTKSQTKKARQDRLKKEIDEKEVVPVVDKIEYAPIIGRKKKSKKPQPLTTATSSAIQSRAPSPIPPEEIKDKPTSKPETPVSARPPSPVPEVEARKEIIQPSEEVHDIPPASPHTPRSTKLDETKKSSPTAATIVAALEKSGELAAHALDMFKSLPAHTARHDITPIDLSTLPDYTPLTSAELADLDAGKPVRRASGNDGRAAGRLLVMPYSRMSIRDLPKYMEDRLVELDKHIRESRPPQKYTHRAMSESAAQAAQLVDDLMRDLTTWMTRPPQPAKVQSVVPPAPSGQQAKVPTTAPETIDDLPTEPLRPPPPTYADDALAYLNQFILPPAPTRGGSNMSRGMSDQNLTSSSDPMQSIGSAIPRTYTTGDPTFSVSGVDVSSSSSNSAAQVPYPTAPIFGSSFAKRASGANALVEGLVRADAYADEVSEATQQLVSSKSTNISSFTDPMAVKQALLASVSAAASEASAAASAVRAAAEQTNLQAIGDNADLSPPPMDLGAMLGGLTGILQLSEKEAEQALLAGRRECEQLEKKLLTLLRRNKRLAGV